MFRLQKTQHFSSEKKFLGKTTFILQKYVLYFPSILDLYHNFNYKSDLSLDLKPFSKSCKDAVGEDPAEAAAGKNLKLSTLRIALGLTNLLNLLR